MSSYYLHVHDWYESWCHHLNPLHFLLLVSPRQKFKTIWFWIDLTDCRPVYGHIYMLLMRMKDCSSIIMRAGWLQIFITHVLYTCKAYSWSFFIVMAGPEFEIIKKYTLNVHRHFSYLKFKSNFKETNEIIWVWLDHGHSSMDSAIFSLDMKSCISSMLQLNYNSR